MYCEDCDSEIEYNIDGCPNCGSQNIKQYDK